ncbi:cytochrome c3 family protein, partial [Sutterella sp.]|uniref:cytochrome c3 family protein n=1 Tax=Sutterella sp. TaxID=1981025 RepID=UPI0026DF7C6F
MKKTLLLLAIASAVLSCGAEAKGFADDHVNALKMPCTACHPKTDEMPTTATCVACHPTDKLVEKTKDVKPHNPHTSPHYGDKLDCVNCHVGHSESENYCGQC